MKSPPSLEVRPTSDRLRETLFNVIAPSIRAVRFLDLCAGSGAIGIEALSRDASHSTFVDRSRRMTALIKFNLELCRITEDESEVVHYIFFIYSDGNFPTLFRNVINCIVYQVEQYLTNSYRVAKHTPGCINY